MGLREYQFNLAMKEVLPRLKEPRARVMLQLPTGAGKTEIAIAISRAYLKVGQRVAFVVHRQHLVAQTVRRFRREGVQAGAGSGCMGEYPVEWGKEAPQPAGVTVVGVETYRKRQQSGLVATEGLVIVDEAHTTSGNWNRQRVFSQFRGAVLGLTATPYRLGKGEGFDGLYTDLVVGPSVRELTDKGYLAECKVYRRPRKMRLRLPMMRPNESDGMYSARVWKHSDTQQRRVLTRAALDHLLSHPEWRPDSKAIVFALTIEHAYQLVKTARELGTRAEVLTSQEDNDSRRRALKRFALANSRGGSPVLVNVDIVREGFDLPEADVLMMLRRTNSLGMYLQMVGRVRRPKADGRAGIVIDIVNNSLLHGLPDDEHEWSLRARDGTRPPVDLRRVRRGQYTTEVDSLGKVVSLIVDSVRSTWKRLTEGRREARSTPSACQAGRSEDAG